MKQRMKGYHRDSSFPHELFVQRAVEAYFLSRGYACKSGRIDLEAIKSNDRWVIEAKGKTASPRVDFCTCLGQLLCHIDDKATRYAVALPPIPEYHRQLQYLSDFVRRQLNLHLLLVEQDGTVRVLLPDDRIKVYDDDKPHARQ